MWSTGRTLTPIGYRMGRARGRRQTAGRERRAALAVWRTAREPYWRTEPPARPAAIVVPALLK